MRLTHAHLAGVVVNVPDELGKQLIASGTYKKPSRAAASTSDDDKAKAEADAKAKAEADAAAKAEADAKAAAEAEAKKAAAGGSK